MKPAPNRTKKLHIRLTEAEEAVIRRNAAAAGRTVSDYLRRLGLGLEPAPVIRTAAYMANYNEAVAKLRSRGYAQKKAEKMAYVMGAEGRRRYLGK